jgi:hypothetical protein
MRLWVFLDLLGLLVLSASVSEIVVLDGGKPLVVYREVGSIPKGAIARPGTVFSI